MTTIIGGSTMEQLENKSQKQWLNPNEVFIEYGFSISTLAKWRMENKYLSFSKIGKYIKYNRTDIEVFLNGNIIKAVVA